MTAEEWNLKYPIGTKVRLTVRKSENGKPKETYETETRSQAYELGPNGKAVVFVRGRPGACSVEAECMDPLVPGDGKPSSVEIGQLFKQRETAAFRKFGGTLQTVCVVRLNLQDRVTCEPYRCGGRVRTMSIKSLLLRYEYVGEASQ